MKKVYFLCMENLKRKHGLNGVFLIIMSLAVLLMNIGLIVRYDFPDGYHKKCDEMNASEIICAVSESNAAEVLSFLESEKLKEIQKKEAVYSYMSYQYNKTDMSSNIVVFNKEKKNSLHQIRYTEQWDNSQYSDLIYLPLIFQTGGKYSLGDIFTLTIGTETFKYHVGGFYEDMILGTTNGGLTSFLLEEKQYNELNEKTGKVLQGQVLFLKLPESQDDATMASRIYDYINRNIGGVSGITLVSESSMESSRCNTSNILAAIIFAFSIIIFVIGIVVIRYRIGDYVHTNIVNLGILKALGYTSNIIIGSVVLQFIFIITISIMLGSVLSGAIMPFVSNVLSMQSGMKWEQKIDVRILFIVAVGMYLVVLIVALLSLLHIHKIYPVQALRKEGKIKLPRKNRFSLETSKINTNLLLSLKCSLYNKKQNLAALLAIIGISFVSMFAIILGYNTVISNTQFVQSVIGVTADVVVVQNTDDSFIPRFDEQLVKMKGVKEAVYFCYEKSFYHERDLLTYVANDFSLVESEMCYEGRSPEGDDEVAISGIASDTFNKKIGDTIELSFGERKKAYKVTGLIQSAYSNGFECQLTVRGYSNLKDNYKGYQLMVYLDGNTTVKEYIESVNTLYKDNINNCYDFKRNTESIISNYVTILRVVILIVFSIVAFMIMLVMYLVVSSVISHMYKQMGIQKSIGYSGWKLILQTAVSFLPVIVVGGIIGSLLGYNISSTLVSSLLYTVGIIKLGLYCNWEMVVVNLAAVLIVAYLTTFIVSQKINKISVILLIHGE